MGIEAHETRDPSGRGGVVMVDTTTNRPLPVSVISFEDADDAEAFIQWVTWGHGSVGPWTRFDEWDAWVTTWRGIRDREECPEEGCRARVQPGNGPLCPECRREHIEDGDRFDCPGCAGDGCAECDWTGLVDEDAAEQACSPCGSTGEIREGVRCRHCRGRGSTYRELTEAE